MPRCIIGTMHTHTTLFSQLLASLNVAADRPSVTVPQDWLQGRTVYGGLAAALCLQACQKTFPGLPPLRAAQFAFIGPAMDRLDFDCSKLREGKSTAFVGVDLSSRGDLAARALFCFGQGRASALSYANLPAPAAPPPEHCELFIPAQQTIVAFAQHFDWRLAGGARPISGNAEPEMLLWVRHREGGLPPSAVPLLALADAPPPAALVRFPAPAPISTITWSLEVLDETLATDDGWWLIRTSAQTIRDGYSSQAMTVWNTRRSPVLAARQSVAIFI